MRRAAVGLLVALVLAATPTTASACSCAPLTRPQFVENASVIFTGIVRAVSRPFSFTRTCSPSSMDPVEVTFDVETVYKGDASGRTNVATAESGASCGYTFVVGKRYTVFASRSGDLLNSGLCNGNEEGAIVAADYGLPAGRPPR